ncbi:hypothetical protein QTV49_003880 [Vibrio vulnificus]|nr:hypothetical protein [Vibrio vulnificus]
MQLQYPHTSNSLKVKLRAALGGRVNFTKSLEFDHSFESHRQMEVDTFNEMFFRSYDEYFFLQITLVDDYHPYINPIKFIRTIKHLPLKDKVMKKLENLVLSDEVPMFFQ